MAIPDIEEQDIEDDDTAISEALELNGLLYRCNDNSEVPTIPFPIPAHGNDGNLVDMPHWRTTVQIPRQILKCWDIRDINYSTKSKLHFWFRWQRKNYTNCVCTFALVYKANLLFANLTSSLSGRDHRTQIDNIDRGVCVSFRLLYTGAMAGFSMARMNYFFAHFQFIFVGSAGGNLADGATQWSGMRFFTWKSDWLKMEDYFDEDYMTAIGEDEEDLGMTEQEKGKKYFGIQFQRYINE